MADRYQDRRFPAEGDYDRGDPHAPANGESDPLAELARLIGQTDPFAMGRANQPVAPARDQYQPPAPADEGSPAGPPPWMQRAARQAPPQDLGAQDYPNQDYPNQDYPSQDYPGQDYPSAVHPLHRYAAQHAAPEPAYHPAPPFADAEYESDPARYDDALYGQLDPDAQDLPHDPAYPDDPYGYEDSDGAEEQAPKRGGIITVVVVLALAVLGTGAAFAYRTYVGSPRSGEPPIIKADAGPTKIVPTPLDANAKLPDRMVPGDGTEKIVPREEAPVDINAKSGPRVVFPPLNQNTNPPPAASVAPGNPPPATAGNGTLPNNEPRKIKTFSVPGDGTNGAAAPVATAAPPSAKPAAAPPSQGVAAARSPPAANAPLSLSPQAAAPPAPAAEPRTRVAATTPEPAAAPSGGGYVVQVSSQRNEADAQASFRALQGKFPAVLGSRAPLIKRADLGEKGVYYRAMVGPFGTPDEASQFCGSLKTAGGQCVVQRN
jgi:hypothetical protein